MVKQHLEDILVEKGLPKKTVDRIEPDRYASMLGETKESTRVWT